MKLAVINYTGTVGKTTVATHLLAPRLGDAPIIAVESINETAASLGTSVEQIKGEHFKDLLRKLLVADDLIVDVGASNSEDFLIGMAKFEDSHNEFDHFIVPVTGGTKEQRETVALLQVLAGQGIPAAKIRLLFNRVDTDVEAEFGIVLKHIEKHRTATANRAAAVYENELFDLLAIKKLPLTKLLADPKDYKALLQEHKQADEKQRLYWADMYSLKALAKGVERNLDAAYAALFA